MGNKTIEITIEELTRLKDIETRFEIMKNQMMDDEYCPKHIQIILGIEHAYAVKQEQKMKQFMELNADMFPGK